MNRHNRLNILQYNVRRSRDMVMASLLRDPGIDDFDIIAIQEPWKNPYTATTHHPAKEGSTSATQREMRKAKHGSASSSTRE
jgi:hypothetical protein